MNRSNGRCRLAVSRRQSGEAGFSLLEVVLALSILAGAVAVLGEVARNGLANAQIARDVTMAQLLCESKMAEVVTGVIPVEPVVNEPIDTTDDPSEPDWLYTVEVEPIDDQGLTAIRVSVILEQPSSPRPAQFSLTRWIIDSDSATSDGMAIE